jgi:hypothetical protein
MPHFPGEFEIPEEWLFEAGIVGFQPTGRAYRSTTTAVLVPLTAVEPVARYVTHPKDWRGFDRARLVRVLKGFVADDEIEAVPAVELPVHEIASSPYRYRVRDGFHRFHASIVAGFDCLPVDL